MKKIVIIIVALIMNFCAFAQAPEKMSYQAVVRNSSNSLVVSQSVGMQISILQGSASGTAVYVETQTITSNANGLVSLEIGLGTVVSGTFATIDWSNGPYFIKTETDPTGGTNYTITGITQLMSVPYALHAKTADNFTGTITETDPVFGTSVANAITVLDTANWNNHTIDTDTHIDSTGIATLGFVAGQHTDSIAIANMGFVTGAGALVAQGGKVVRDFLTWAENTSSQGAEPIHIKTNIPENSDVMYRILVEGYSYGVSGAINSDVCGYTYAVTGGIINTSTNNYANGATISQYISSDGYVVIKLTTTNHYNLSFSASAWFTAYWYNPYYQISPSFQITGTVVTSISNL